MSISKDAILAHFAAHPGDSKRDVARALHVKGADRAALKRILKELAEEGAIERGPKKSFTPPGALPETAVVEITGQDADGELIGRPAHWERAEPPPSLYVNPGRAEEEGPPLGAGDRVLAHISRTREGYEARVIKRLGASAHRVLGVLRREHRGPARIEPVDRKTRLSFQVDEGELGGAQPGELVLAEPLAGREHGAPRARIVERIGSMAEPKTVSLIAIHAHGIPDVFPREVLAEAERAKPVETGGHTDLRDIPFVTIDPEDARDHDDAVWAGPDPDPGNRGGHIVVVAIADVAHYVTPASALDAEAMKRGNSVYFPDRVVPMLPERLSADLCSLKENIERPCLAVRMAFDARGVKRRHEFLRGVMRSAARLTYRQAQNAFDKLPPPERPSSAKASAGQEKHLVRRSLGVGGGRAGGGLEGGEMTPPRTASRLGPPLSGEGISGELSRDVLQPLWLAYRALAQARDGRGPLDLDLPERRIVIGANGKIESIAFKERLESMRLIEEMMIQANVAAAETLEKARTPLVYRVHEEPSQEKLAAFADYLKTISIPFAKGQVMKPAIFNRILAHAKGTPHAEVINDVVLRTQAQAVYAPDNIGHFGLNLLRYAHFTSPIRRYADLVVHRALIRALGLGEGGLSGQEMARLSDTAEHISMTERRAMAAERDSMDRYVAAFMEDRVGAVFEGRISGVTRFGLFVRLKETGADGLLPMRSLGAEFFRHDEKRHALIGGRTRTAYRLGDILKVKLVEATPLTGGLRFELADAEFLAAHKPHAHPSRGPRRRR